MFNSDSEREKQFLDELYEQYYDVLFRYCLPYLNRDIDSSADCVHMVFDVAAAKVKTLMKHPNIGGWMYATAKNCIKKELRRIKMEQTKFERLVDSMPMTTQIDPILEDEVDALRDRIVDTLNEAERLLYQLYYVENRTTPEIGQMLNITADAAKMRLYRVRIKLLKELNKYI